MNMSQDIQGPQEMQAEWFDALIEMLDRAFRRGCGCSMRSDYPVFLDETNAGNLFVCRSKGKVVSHLGYLPVTLSYFGHPVELGMLGAVATDPQWRGQGLGTKTLQYALQKASERNLSMLMISGKRGLYRRNGARCVGSVAEYSVPAEILSDGGAEIEKAGPADAPVLSLLHQKKPFRFIRPLEMWEKKIEAEICRDTPSQKWIVKKQGRPAAYFVLPESQKNGIYRVYEYGGSMRTVMNGLGRLTATPNNTTEVRLNTYWHEKQEREILEGLGARLERRRPMEGTLRITNAEALLTALRPYFQELVGRNIANGLSIREAAPDHYILGCGAENLEVGDAGMLTDVLFADGLQYFTEELEGKDTLGRAVKGLFPLIAPKYDMNYV